MKALSSGTFDRMWYPMSRTIPDDHDPTALSHDRSLESHGWTRGGGLDPDTNIKEAKC